MPRRGQPSLKQLRELCGQPGPDDGIDPRETLRQHARSKGGRKAQGGGRVTPPGGGRTTPKQPFTLPGLN